MTDLLTSTHFWLAVAFLVVVIFACRPVARLIKKAGMDRAAEIRAEQERATGERKEAQRRLDQVQALISNQQNIRKSVLKRALGEADAMTQDFQERLKTQIRLKEEEAEGLMAQQKERMVHLLKNKAYQAFSQQIMAADTPDIALTDFLKTMDTHATVLQEAYRENPVEEMNQQTAIRQATIEGAYQTLKQEEKSGVDDATFNKILAALDTLPKAGIY